MFFEKKLDFFLKIANGGRFAVDCVSNGIISSECVDYEFFGKKKFSKLENMMESFFEEKRFRLFKSLLYYNGKAENMPVETGSLVCCLPYMFASIGKKITTYNSFFNNLLNHVSVEIFIFRWFVRLSI